MVATLKDRKNVYGTSEIPHLWAHGIPEGRRIRNATGSLYAEGDTLYSYGPHFPIARRVSLPSPDGPRTVYLYTTWRYSVTTRGHCYAAERAMHGNGVRFDIDPNFWDALTDRKRSAVPVAEHFQALIDNEARSAAAPRIRPATRERHMARAAALIAEWREIHSLFRLRVSVDRVKAPGSLDEVRAKYAAQFAAEREREAQRKRDEAERKAREVAAALERAKDAAPLIARYRAGEDRPTMPNPKGGRPLSLSDIPYPVLRLIRHAGNHSADGGEVETSYGARVSIADARRALSLLPRLIERAKSDGVAESSESIGHYRGMSATPAALRIGCHTIPWAEVAAFCADAGWECPALPSAE